MTEVSVTDSELSEPLAAVVAGEDQLRANTYSLLGALLAAPPGPALVEKLSEIDAEEGDASSLLAAAWGMLKGAAGRAECGLLDDEYHELFIGVGRGELVPYGSWYLTGFLMEQPLAQLRSDLDALGLGRKQDVAEPEDHAAALCEAMSLIVAAEAGIDPERQAEFFTRHIQSWMGRFFRDLQQADAAHFYRAVGQLGEQFLEVESQYLAMAAPRLDDSRSQSG
jgi:TorA maturation chaperone TorD